MIKVLLLLLLLVGGLLVGPYLIDQQGYVLIALGHYTVETSFIGMVVTLVITWLLIRAVVWVIRRLFRLSHLSWSFFGERKQRKQQQAFLRGLIALDEADFAEAQKQLNVATAFDSGSGVEYLAAAQAALQLGQNQQARDWWQKAASHPQTELAATLNLARDAMAAGDYQQALNLMQSVDSKHALHPGLVALKAQSLAALGRWQLLKENLKEWKKPLGVQAYDHWMRAAAGGIFAEIASKEGANALKERWLQLPRSARKDIAQQTAYIRQLIGQNMHKDAEQALVGFMDYPDPAMLPLYKEIKAKQPTAALKQLEKWLKQDDKNVEILSALAHLAYNSGDYRLADKVVDKRLALQTDPEDVLLQAKIKEALQQPMQALDIYKRALPGDVKA